MFGISNRKLAHNFDNTMHCLIYSRYAHIGSMDQPTDRPIDGSTASYRDTRNQRMDDVQRTGRSNIRNDRRRRDERTDKRRVETTARVALPSPNSSIPPTTIPISDRLCHLRIHHKGKVRLSPRYGIKANFSLYEFLYFFVLSFDHALSLQSASDLRRQENISCN